MKQALKSILPVAVLLALWQAAASAKIWSEYVLPSPERVLRAFATMIQSGVLFEHIWVSFCRVLTGFSIAFALAFLLGLLAGLRPNSSVYYNHIVEFLRNVPPLSIIALLILWFGIGETSKIIIIVLASFFPMFLNIKKGLSSCDPKLVEVGHSLNFTQGQIFRRILFPNALPDILVGMRVGMGYSWRAIIGAEMIAAASGLGYMILDAQQMSRSDKVIVGIFVIGIAGYLCDRLFSLVIKKTLHGGVDNSWS